MYERAKYFRDKFIRNSIAAFAICGLLIYTVITQHKSVMPGLIIFPAVAFAWLYLGLWINNKLKSKHATDISEVTDEKISFKQVQFIFSIFFVVVVLLYFKHLKIVNYLAVPIILIYAWWLFSQMKMLSNYFSTKPHN
ncbi:MAG TPA: hypothetical protein PLU85_02265 [Bacteroidia bacterium]|nr:hypothetical protein [Bacteroidia bacterium]MBP7713803.1 hypothetical protein [Bacteroidia bacterium]MBP8668383.1 hypothetical protein [Bacteroidia bacterium]HOZ82928.1 hypothetical protein [Bacteroidia bacterium]HQW17855.1 hypothetical protein [Bacteroidia bacterium]